MDLRQRRLLTVALAISLYAIWNIAAWWESAPQAFGDTYRYFGSTLFDIQNPGITTVFVYTTVESPRLVTLIQVSLSVFAWIAFAALIRIRLNGSWVSWALPMAVLIFSMTSPIWSWHLLLGSESFALSAGVLWLASILAVREYLSPAALTLTSAAAGFLLVSRPQIFPVVLTVELVLLIWRWRRSRGVPGLVLPISALLIFEVWAIARLQLLASNETFRFRYAIDNLVDKRDSFGKYVEAHMPSCEPLSGALNGPRPWDDVWQIKEKLIGLCPESFLWLRSPSTQLTTWAAEIPAQAISNFGGAIVTVALPIYAPDAHATPEWVNSILIPDWPLWKLMLVYTTFGILIGVFAGVRIRLNISWVLGFALIFVGVAIYFFAVWGSDGIELNRHLMPLTLMLPLAILVFPASLAYRPSAVVTDPANAAQVGTTSDAN